MTGCADKIMMAVATLIDYFPSEILDLLNRDQQRYEDFANAPQKYFLSVSDLSWKMMLKWRTHKRTLTIPSIQKTNRVIPTIQQIFTSEAKLNSCLIRISS